MTPAEKAKHALKDDWQDAYVEEKIRDLVKVLNWPEFDIRTIAACEGHLSGFNSPFVYFQCPTHIAGMIEKRLLLAIVRQEGLNYQWSLKGAFNAEFELCFELRSRELQDVHFHGSAFSRFWTYRAQRRKIDDDLALLARMIEGLKEGVKFTRIEDIPDPYDNKTHCRKKRQEPFFAVFRFLTGLRQGIVSKRVGMIAFGTRIKGSLRNFCVALNARFQHKCSPNNRANPARSRNYSSLLVGSIILVICCGLVVFANASDLDSVQVKRVRYVYDGDTFYADLDRRKGRNVAVRVAGVDTPEIKGKCQHEIERAIQAREFVKAVLNNARVIELKNMRRGYYGRIVAGVWINGRNLAAILIERNYGRPYTKGWRIGWC